MKKPSVRQAFAATVAVAVLLGGGYAADALVDSPGSGTSPAATATAITTPAVRASTTKKHAKVRRVVALRAALRAVAPVIGVTPKQLVTAVRGGQTVAQVAQAHGVDPQKAIDAIVTLGTKRIQTALTNGKIDAATAQRLTARLTKVATRLVDNTPHGAKKATVPGAGAGATTPSTSA